jgi:hypothetical protein
VRELGGVLGQRVDDVLPAPDEDAGVPVGAVAHEHLGEHRARLLDERLHAPWRAVVERTAVQRRAGTDVAERGLGSRRAHAHGHERLVSRGNARRADERVAEELGERDGEVGVEATEDRLGARATNHLLRPPRECRCGTERPRLDQHVRFGDFGDRGVDGRRDVSAGENEHPLRRNERREPRDRLGDERSLSDQLEQLLRTPGAAQRPEARPDAPGQHDRPHGRIRRQLGFLLRLFTGKRRDRLRIGGRWRYDRNDQVSHTID